ncbi:hypothetical protein BC629DRAFT_1571911 [Irpex lacteus]|nr:hypothetical protein BC629DRAFT_1571911 [Irpex lacteus]
MGGRDGEDRDELDDADDDKTEKKKKTHGGPQTSDQDFIHSANAALEEAVKLGSYVRVTRGAGASKYAPTKGYRYDGLYYVENPRREIGPTGQYLVCKFDFVVCFFRLSASREGKLTRH